jgi:hypothetical protein
MPTFRDDNFRELREAEKLTQQRELREKEMRVGISVEAAEIDEAIKLGLMPEADRKDAAVIAELVKTVLKTSFSNIKEHRAREACRRGDIGGPGRISRCVGRAWLSET